MFKNYFFSVFKNLYKRPPLLIKENYVCALSGGRDSMFLFFFFLHLRYLWDIKLSVIYNNHLWQQNNFYSFREIYKVVYLFQTSFFLSINEKPNRNEVVARNWRQDSLNRIALLEKTKKILVGHTATDFIETGLFNLIRGSGPKGLCSLKKNKKKKIPISTLFFFSQYPRKMKVAKKKLKPPKILFFRVKQNKSKKSHLFLFFNEKQKQFLNNYSINFIKSFVFDKKLKMYNEIYRPLLFLHRNDIIKLSNYYFIPNSCDFSNNSILFSRNIIRHKIFIFFRKFFNNRFDLKFYQYLQIIEDEQQFFDVYLKKKKKKLKNSSKNRFYLIPKSLQRHYIFVLLTAFLKGECSFSQIETIRIKIFYR